MSRYGKRADMVVHEEEPFNAETGLSALAEDVVTPTNAFYVRGHGAVPEIDPLTWRLHVHGLVERELVLSLGTLREALREREVTATLQCAGNRRAGLIAVRDIPGEAPWGPGATGTATWTGVALGDVLALAGPRGGHVGFKGADVSSEAKPAQPFGGSIPLEKACRPEVLLAWAMNGDPLPVVHGAPLRVVVPGYIGARSVKWLERIEVARSRAGATFSTSSTGCYRKMGSWARASGCRSGWSRSMLTCSHRRMATRSPQGQLRSGATRSPAGSDMSHVSTSRPTEARAGHKRSC